MYIYDEKKKTKAEQKKFDSSKTPLQMRSSNQNVTGIPDMMKTRFENLSGLSFDDVRVHYNSDKPAQLSAYAYTQGNQVYVAPGQQQHLTHELGHVVQQKQGLVRPTRYLQGVTVNDDEKLEREADLMGNASTSALNSTELLQKKTEAKVVQKAGYLEDLKESNRWGGEPEAHAIASHFGFTTRIYRSLVNLDNERTYTRVGIGEERDLFLYWNGNHYTVINREGIEVYNPLGDGNCMFEAISFIKAGEKVLDIFKKTDGREKVIRLMRNFAATWLATQPVLLGVLEEEYDRELEQEKRDLEFLNYAIIKFPSTHFCIHERKENLFFVKWEKKLGDREENVKNIINEYIQENKVEEKNENKFFDSLKKSGYYTIKKEPEEETTPDGADKEAQDFNKKFPLAVWLQPRDIVKNKIKGTVFEDHLTFISSTFKKESPSLPKFDNKTVYHDTQGGKGGGFTIFGVLINGHRFLVASGGHASQASKGQKSNGYKIEFSAAPKGNIWGEGKIVNFGITANTEETSTSKESKSKKGTK